jgi:TRAP transporter TAXI family solute receptor
LYKFINSLNLSEVTTSVKIPARTHQIKEGRKMKGMNSKKRSCLLSSLPVVLCWTLLFVFPPGGKAAAPEKIRLSMGTAPTGTWIYMFGAILSESWKKYLPNLDITVMATPGSTANYIPMDKGELDLAGATNAGDFYAMNAMYFAKDKLSNFSSILPATKGFNHAFTYADSPIKVWKDLEGKLVNISTRAMPTSILAEETCRTLGIKPRFIFSTPAEAVDMVKDRRVDAMILNVGAPYSGIMDIATTQKIRFLPMTLEEQKKVHSALPYAPPAVLPAKTYAFQTESVPTTAWYQSINARPGLPDDLVYKMVKVIWEHWDEVVKASPAAKWVTSGDIIHMIAPIHPGAAKYYREVGVQIPDHKIWKKK